MIELYSPSLMRSGQLSSSRPVAPIQRSATRRAVDRLWELLTRSAFERGLDTDAMELEAEHLHPDRTYYAPSGWSWLRRALPRRSIKPTDVFVDFGSGKGRVVCRAARYPFRRVIGVEISEYLNQVARTNVAHEQDRFRCDEVQLITADAAAHAIPSDMTVAYLYDPLSGRSLTALLENIIASIDQHPRTVKLIFSAPGEARVIEQTRRFRVTRRHRVGRWLGTPALITVYTSVTDRGTEAD